MPEAEPTAQDGNQQVAVGVDHDICSGTAHCQQSMPQVFVVIDRKSYVRPDVDWESGRPSPPFEAGRKPVPWFAISVSDLTRRTLTCPSTTLSSKASTRRGRPSPPTARRARSPTYPTAAEEFFQITRYDLITEVLRNHQAFSNAHGVTVAIESYSDEEQVLSFADPPRHTNNAAY